MNIHIFRRDLRLEDNTALNNTAEKTVPIFIFTPNQIKNNEYKSDFAIQFLCNSLTELDAELQKKQSQLHVFYGETLDILTQLITKHKITSITVNADYTPFSQNRDSSIKDLCEEYNIEFNSHHDALLTIPGTVTKDDKKPYTIYTPFYNKASQQHIIKEKTKHPTFVKIPDGDTTLIEKFKTELPNALCKGGRNEGLKLLQNLAKVTDYKTQRDIPSVKGTSLLAAHHKFGTISIRETYFLAEELFGPGSQFIKELYWRDFYTHIAFQFPHVFGHTFKLKYNDLEWQNNQEFFQKWCEGETGFPIVDAGMRQLNQTGYMHNRVRMIVSSFLTKDLHIDWQWGEKYFAQKLTDYDPCVNNGSWQWAASTGCDAQPYFRIFNPWLQLKRFDPECIYVKKWVPELTDLSAKEILNLENQRPLTHLEYPKPVVNHKDQKDYALAMFKSI